MMELLPISLTEAARYMGVRGEPDDSIMKLLKNAEILVRENVHPRYVYREAEITTDRDGIRISGVNAPFTGNDIQKHLKGCRSVILLAATLSETADKLIRQAAVRNIAESLAVDCICSAAVEQVCDRAEEEIFSRINAPYRTWRFSPGYGDLPLELQGELLRALNSQRRIGLTATENSLLIPSKSVTAIIGISDTPVMRQTSGCAGCSMRESCGFSKMGKSCGKNT